MPKGFEQVTTTQNKNSWKPGFWQKRTSEAVIFGDLIELLGYLKDIFEAIQKGVPESGWVQIPTKTITMLILPWLNTGIAATKMSTAEKEHHSTINKAQLATGIAALSAFCSFLYYIFWMVTSYGDNKNNNSNDLKNLLPYLLMASLVANATKRFIEKLQDDQIREERITDLEAQIGKGNLPKTR